MEVVQDPKPGEVTMVARLHEAARASGILPEDPLWALIEAMALTITELDDQRATMMVSTTAIVDRLADLLRLGRDTARAEADMVRTKAQATETALINRIAEASAKAASAALARKVRVVDRRAAAVIGLCLAGALTMGAVTGWELGTRTARTVIAETEFDLRAAFRDGPDAAGIWVALMQWNDPRAALQICRDPNEIMVQNGRHACRVPLWMEKPLPLGH